MLIIVIVIIITDLIFNVAYERKTADNLLTSYCANIIQQYDILAMWVNNQKVKQTSQRK